MNHQDIEKSWYSRVLYNYSRKTVVAVGITILVLLVTSVIQLVNGASFEWKNIAPIEAPDFWTRILYSALTYVSLGAALYYVGFYKFLSMMFGRDRRGYREAKSRIWGLLMLVMFIFIVPSAINILNSTLSFIYNILLLFVYVSPVTILVFSTVITFVIYHRLRTTRLKGISSLTDS
jgi:heme/copper-type cytochrome/quinol oxidase subunit 2